MGNRPAFFKIDMVLPASGRDVTLFRLTNLGQAKCDADAYFDWRKEMNILMARSEVFGDTEMFSYGIRRYDDPETAVSVFKAEIIKKILRQREYDITNPEIHERYGRRKEDRFYIFDLRKKEDNPNSIKEKFVKSLNLNEKNCIDHDEQVFVLPEGWEEIIPENYNIVEVAFRKKNEG